jgi:hypothetical protein
MNTERIAARSTLLYFSMLVLLGVGFEGIRRVGNTLTPPRHIAGWWNFVVPSSLSSCPLLEFAEAGKGSLQVEQSGRYLVLTFTDIYSTKMPARFEGGKLRGSGFSTAPCFSLVPTKKRRRRLSPRWLSTRHGHPGQIRSRWLPLRFFA